MAGSCILTARSGTVILAMALLCSACSTTWTPFQGSFVNPVQIFPENTDVRGMRIDVLYGKNASLDGLDVGLVNRVEKHVRGLQAGGVNLAGELDGVDVGVVNMVEERVRGLQLAQAGNFAGEFYGVQLAGLPLFFVPAFNISQNVVGAQITNLFNRAEEHVRGLQLAGIVNFAGEIAGVQLAGIYNQSESVVGVQISSLVNDTEKLVGLQIGLLNFNSSGPLPFFPFFNFGFADDSEEVEGSKANKD
jgi:hypothetical protein